MRCTMSIIYEEVANNPVSINPILKILKAADTDKNVIIVLGIGPKSQDCFDKSKELVVKLYSTVMALLWLKTTAKLPEPSYSKFQADNSIVEIALTKQRTIAGVLTENDLIDQLAVQQLILTTISAS